MYFLCKRKRAENTQILFFIHADDNAGIAGNNDEDARYGICQFSIALKCKIKM